MPFVVSVLEARSAGLQIVMRIYAQHAAPLFRRRLEAQWIMPLIRMLLCAPRLALLTRGHGPMHAVLTDTWASRWQHSSWKKADGAAGEFKLTAGKWYGDAEADKGIQTSTDSKFYALYAPLDKTFDNTGKDLVLQFSAKHEQGLDCGGGYIKLLPASRCAWWRACMWLHAMPCMLIMPMAASGCACTEASALAPVMLLYT